MIPSVTVMLLQSSPRRRRIAGRLRYAFLSAKSCLCAWSLLMLKWGRSMGRRRGRRLAKTLVVMVMVGTSGRKARHAAKAALRSDARGWRFVVAFR